jgi:hypothetical protein
MFIGGKGMIGAEYFLSVAGLALALAGFSGLVANFRPSNTEPWTATEIAGIEYIYQHAFGAFFLALLPLPILYTELLKPHIWQICGGFFFIFVVVEAFIQVSTISNLCRAKTPPRVLAGLRFLVFVSVAIGVLVLYSSFSKDAMWGFSWGLLWLLFVVVAQFFVFTTHAFQRKEKKHIRI